MAAHVYPLYKQTAEKAGFDITAVNVKVALLDSSYTYSAAHQFFSNLTGVIASSGNLASVTATAGVVNAGNVTIASVASGHTIAAIALYRDTGTGSTSDLICFVDGFSQATNGGNITVAWDTGSNKIFAL
jgi:hypothetical protein